MRIRRYISILLFIVLVITSVIGCNKENVKEIKGRFKQAEVEIPNVKGMYDFKKLKDNNLYILAQSSENIFTIYSSVDNGKMWETKEFSLPGENIIDKYVISAAIDNDNNIAMIYSDTKNVEGNNASNIKAKIINNNKSVDIQLDEEQKKNISKISFATNGDLICICNNSIIQFDGESGKQKFKYESSDGGISDLCLNSDKLIALTKDSTIEYDIRTGEKVDNLEKINEYMTDSIKLYSSKEENSIYFSNSKGLYKYNLDSNESENLIDATTSTFGENNSVIQFLIKNNEDNYLVINYNADNNSYELISYSYTEVDESNELVIYSLRKSEMIGQAISKYEKSNKEISIKYEIGVTEGSGVTESDAIRTLNTEIMAGTGPDIILMDNMSIESYIKKGLLEDINDIVDSEKDELFNNITNSYVTDSGTYGFPLRFEVPVIIGQEKYINNIKDIDSLTNSIGGMSDNNIGTIMEIFQPEDIVNLLYNTSAGTWVNEDNTCNKEKIKKFLEDSKEVYTNTKKTMSKSYYDWNEKGINGYNIGDKYNFSINKNLNHLATGSDLLDETGFKIVIGNIISLEHLMEITPVLNYNINISYKTFSAQDQNVFIPTEIASISSKSNKKDLAKEFISELLSEDLQSISNSIGIPVNKTALINKFKSHSEGYFLGDTSLKFGDGSTIKYENKWITEAEINKFIENIETLKSPSKYNSNYLYDVNKEAANYISGKSSLDDTVDKIASKIQLSLAEK